MVEKRLTTYYYIGTIIIEHLREKKKEKEREGKKGRGEKVTKVLWEAWDGMGWDGMGWDGMGGRYRRYVVLWESTSCVGNQ